MMDACSNISQEQSGLYTYVIQISRDKRKGKLCTETNFTDQDKPVYVN